MLDILLGNRVQWEAESTLERERMVDQHEPMAAKRNQWAATRNQWAAKRAEHTKRSTVGPRPNIYTIVDPVRFCGGVNERDRFLGMLCFNFNSHSHLFPRGGPDLVKYAISLSDAWSNHQNLALRQTVMTDPLELVCNISVDSDPCIPDFDLFTQEMAKVYGDKD